MSTNDDQSLYWALKDLGVVPESKLQAAFKLSKVKDLSFSEVLLRQDLVSDENLGKLTADLLGFPFINFSKVSIKEEILKIVPEIVAKKQKVIAFKKDEQGLHLAMVDPTNIEMVEFVKKKVGDSVISYLATERDLTDALVLYRKGIEKEFSQIIAKSAQAVKGAATEAPIIKIVDTILSYADQNKASDIHIEPQEEKSIVRFRIDGLLHDVVTLSKEIHFQVVTRIKVMANLRTDEHQASQDGKLVFKTDPPTGGEKLDVRVSIVPITEGEKVVLRLLSEKSRQFGLSSLGLVGEDLKKVKSAIDKPHGMILATGPTGCGKTTTLYSILKILNKREVNISTIEDPVEYDVDGVNQIQVNSRTELTFAKGLRSIVRQDPDIILVGEIRDSETAGIAINAAMTGHLVLSTLHTNDAATSLPRLLDMKIEPFLVASTINLIIAQRLVRKICQKCRVSQEIKEETGKIQLPIELVKKYFGKKNTIRVYQGKGCSVCHQTGYVGRIGIFEVIEMRENIKKAVVGRNDSDTIRKLAIKNGMKTMLEDGLEKAIKGETTVEEVFRVTKE